MISDARHPAEVYFGALTGPNEAPDGIAWRRLTRLNPLAEETWAQVPVAIADLSGRGWLGDAGALHAATAPCGDRRAADDSAGAWRPDALRTVTTGAAGSCSRWSPPDSPCCGVNPRGSIGRGVAFADAVLGDMGGKDYEDLMLRRGYGGRARAG